MTQDDPDDGVVVFEMAIHKEEAVKIADILRRLDEPDPQLAEAIERLADILALAGRP